MTLHLVRHASAGHRNGADPGDRKRHLDGDGQAHAELIAKHLRDSDISLVLSSPFPRCVETVQPLATLLGLDVGTDARLAEGTDISDAWKLLASLADTDAVLCSHGDVIPELVSRNRRRGMLVPGKSGCAKASVWTLTGWNGDHFSNGSSVKVRD
jgi:8-oxo-dGTP diphosphatase